MRGNGLKVVLGEVQVGYKKNFLMERLGEHWNGLPRVQHPWECSKKTNTWKWHLRPQLMVGLGDFREAFSNLKDPMNL